MKTIEQAAKEYACIAEDKYHNESLCHSPYDMADAFEAGVEFAQRWIPVEEEMPDYYKPVIVKTEKLEIIAWRAWCEVSGDVYTINGTDLIMMKNPTHWRPIEFK